MGRARTTLLGGLILPAALFAAAAVAITWDGLTDELHAADVAVVPGNAIAADGTPSPRLQARLDRAVELYRQGLFPTVIVSGGVGSSGYDEAVAMQRYLIDRGVPEDCILVDSAGLDTYATAQNAARSMRERGMQSALVVSQYFHVPRARLALQRFGVGPVYTAHAGFFELRDVYSTAREVVAFAAYLLRPYESAPVQRQ